MADSKGRIGKLAVSAAGSVYTDLEGVKDVSLPFSRGTMETTDFDSAGWKEALCGIGSYTLSVTLNYEEGVTGQEILWTNLTTPALLYFRWRPKGDNVGVDDEFIFTANLTSLEQGQAVDNAAELTLEYEGSGAPTLQTQA